MIDEKNVIQVQPNKIKSKNSKLKSLITIPKLEAHIQQQIWIIKKYKVSLMILGLILIILSSSYFSESIAQYNQHCIGICPIVNVSMQIIFQQIFSFMTDIVSINKTILLSISQYLFCIILNLTLQNDGSNQQMKVFLIIFSNVSYYQLILLCRYLILDTQYNLRVRFDIIVFLQILNSVYRLYPNIIYYLEYKQIYNNIYVQIGYLLILLLGTLIIIFVYGKIERLRLKSDRYRKYIAHQGVGISFKVIFGYYNNKNYIFILFILFAFHTSYDQQFNSTSSQLDFGYFKIQQNQYKIVNGILYFVSTLLGSIASLILNRKNWIIESSMKITLQLIPLQIILKFIKLLLSLVQIYGLQYESLQIIQIFLQVFQNTNMIIIFFQYFEAGSSLVDEQSSIKCQGFSLMCNSEFIGICLSSSPLSPMIKLIMQLIILILANVYAKKYLKNRSFIQLEQNLKNYLQKQNSEYELSN
ncbi:hypothetical protein ABPG74_011515 [Tetrahymena malaccensis]